jgi:hypothetical protein
MVWVAITRATCALCLQGCRPTESGGEWHAFSLKRCVTTLALGSRSKLGVVRLRAKKKTRESHLMLPGVQRVWGNEPSHSQVNSHVGSWSPNGLLNFQNAIARVKTHHLEKKFISLKSYWNLNIWNGLASPIWTSKTQVMAKRKVRSQTGNLIFDH